MTIPTPQHPPWSTVMHRIEQHLNRHIRNNATNCLECGNIDDGHCEDCVTGIIHALHTHITAPIYHPDDATW